LQGQRWREADAFAKRQKGTSEANDSGDQSGDHRYRRVFAYYHHLEKGVRGKRRLLMNM